MVPLQEGGDGVRKGSLTQVPGRDVDRYAQLQTYVEPSSTLLYRCLKDPLSERANEPRLLGERDKLIRWDQAVVWTDPAHEGLSPIHPHRAHLNFWLVV